MPSITQKRIGVALDMHGCPNKCRHCYLGIASKADLTDDDLRWTVSQFRNYLDTHDTPIKSLAVSPDFREPDYSDDYRHLYALVEELGDGKPERYELLSIWRLARDSSYAEWAKSIGPDTCQISFFGMEETTDWFYRRKGAFKDALTATERLLEVGMKPRWQIFLTRKLLPEIDDLMRLIEKLKLYERVQALGSEFQLFMHAPGSDGEGRKIEYLRPAVNEVQSLPADILESSKKHFNREILWRTEKELYSEIMESSRTIPKDESVLDEPDVFWFLVNGNWDVFSNVGTLEPWWRLGNLKQDSVATIMDNFLQDRIPGLDVLYNYPRSELARQYGDPDGSKIYVSAYDLVNLYLAKYCEDNWKKERR